ncbi:MAG: undecaprenyl pyrophosphate phosphatase [Mucilaginibacter sp.]|nr:undecaprenyl pyrophosphate phosphatase [Mucilaginibacter sp.]
MEKGRKRIVGYVLGLISIGFVLLTISIFVFPHSFIDLAFSQEVQEFQNPFLDSLMKLVSWFGNSPGSSVTVLSGALLFLIFKYRKEALFMLLTAASALVSTLIKILVNRPRPSEPLVRVVQKANQQSFPSGHVMFYIVYFGFLTVLMYHLKTIPKAVRIIVAAISVLLIFTVPYSRIYLGDHWFTDVLGGFLMGMLLLYLLSYFYFRKPAK